MMRHLRLFCLVVLLSPSLPAAAVEANSVRFDDVRPYLEDVLSDLSRFSDQLEALQTDMERSAKANRDYDEQKNVFLSSMLAITTIAAVCQYESDHLALFIDLRPKNRLKLYDIRMESLATSVRQIENMNRQIQINYTIFPADFFEHAFVERERRTIADALAGLQRALSLLRSVKRKH